jgi:hypothetical protein
MKLYSDLKSYRPTGTLSNDGQFRTDDLKALEIYNDPCTRYWLKEQIRRCFNCDPVDALNDAEVLVELLQDRVTSIQTRQADAAFKSSLGRQS